MKLKEKTSERLGIKYVYLPDVKKFLCENGVMFTLEEYKNGIAINDEYEKRAKEDNLYDYVYAKSTGLLRKKRGYAKVSQREDSSSDKPEQSISTEDKKEVQETKIQQETVPAEESNGLWNSMANDGRADRWNTNIQNRQKEAQGNTRSVFMIVLLLAFTSVISMYISTLHTATYLFAYVDVFSAWLMSASVTAYNATAFEVSVLFHTSKRNFMAIIFMLLWILVTLFSMATTVSVFYDQFNFQETQIANENKQVDSNKKALGLLRTKEKDLRESIDFKKKDIEYRQEHDYATTAVRTELNDLQNQLQANLTEQENLLKETPEVTEEKIQRKESLFAFLGRLWKLEGGILEFIMSTLSAIFVNLIAPLSLTAVTELMKNKKQILTK
jgi:hypothetical protein